jgi:hypothetical protein
MVFGFLKCVLAAHMLTCIYLIVFVTFFFIMMNEFVDNLCRTMHVCNSAR